MENNITNIIGFIAGIFGLCIQLPQIYKIIHTKSATDLSYGTIFIMTTNQFFWFSYAYLVNDPIYMLSSVGHFTIDIIELSLKIYYDRRKKINERQSELEI